MWSSGAWLGTNGRPRHERPDISAEARPRCRLALPEVTEGLSHGSPSFFVRDTSTFAMFDHLIEEAYRTVAPKQLVAQLDAR